MENEIHKNYFKHKLIIFLIIIGIAFLFWSSAELQKLFSNSILFTNQYLEQRPLTGIVLFWAISTLSAIISPFSSIPIVPFIAAIWGNIPTILLLLLGWLSGSTISYFLGSSTGYVLAQKIFSPKSAAHYKQELSMQANFLTVLLFRLAMPTEIAGYVLGTIKYNLIKYFIATTIAETLFAFLVVYSGEAFVEANKGKFVFFVFLILAITSIMFYFFKKLRKNNSQEI